MATMKRIFGLMILAALCSMALVRTASAQQPTPSDDDVNRIARQMYCPVCENTPLDVCATQACAQWRALIRDKLAAGWSDDQIKQYFVQQYGARVLAEPPRQGLNWLIYIVPPLLFAAGVFVLFRALASMRRPGSAQPAGPGEPPAAEDDDYLRRVEDELSKRN
jgi:cytochrome c-type biogenesis protein CcmH